MLTGKQRAYLRGLANSTDTIVHIGKGGITPSVVTQADEALSARELIKCRVLENSLMTAREACAELAEKTGSEGVQVIGSRFVLFRQNKDIEKQKIKLEQ
jgi:RNA-binding protein